MQCRCRFRLTLTFRCIDESFENSTIWKLILLKKVLVIVSHIVDLLIVPVKGYFPSFSQTLCVYAEAETRVSNKKVIKVFMYSEKFKWSINFSQNKGQSFNYGKYYTIREKSYIIHTLSGKFSVRLKHKIPDCWFREFASLLSWKRALLCCQPEEWSARI